METNVELPERSSASRLGLLAFLPEGREIPTSDWRQRHRWVMFFVAAHAVALPLFGIYNGWAPAVAIGEGLIVAALGGLASVPRFGRRFRSALASLACVTASAILVQFSHGVIEAHFHYFVVVALIALYQDWVPFLLAVGYVAVDHGVIGTIAPAWVYNHPDAIAHPWRWSIIHAVMVLGESASLLVIWKANEQARAQTERVLHSTREGILGFDHTGRVSFANRAAATMLRRDEGALVGATLETLVEAPPGTTRPHLTARLGEGTLVGASTPIEWTANPIVDHGETVGWVASLRDTTDRRDNVELRQANASLRQANQTLEAFSYVVGHDLKEPTRAIENYLEAALREQDVTRTKSLVQRAQASNQRLYALLRGLLEYARVSSGMIHVKSVEIEAVLKNDVYRAQYESALRDRGAMLQVECTFPSVAADEVALAQALGNLVLNGVKHNPNPAPRVTLRAGAHDEKTVEVIVDDNGRGFPADIVARFEQVRSARPSTLKGGFGLIVAQRAVQGMGGDMTLESNDEGGGRIRLRLRRADEAPAARIVTRPVGE